MLTGAPRLFPWIAAIAIGGIAAAGMSAYWMLFASVALGLAVSSRIGDGILASRRSGAAPRPRPAALDSD